MTDFSLLIRNKRLLLNSNDENALTTTELDENCHKQLGPHILITNSREWILFENYLEFLCFSLWNRENQDWTIMLTELPEFFYLNKEKRIMGKIKDTSLMAICGVQSHTDLDNLSFLLKYKGGCLYIKKVFSLTSIIKVRKWKLPK